MLSLSLETVKHRKTLFVSVPVSVFTMKEEFSQKQFDLNQLLVSFLFVFCRAIKVVVFQSDPADLVIKYLKIHLTLFYVLFIPRSLS